MFRGRKWETERKEVKVYELAGGCFITNCYSKGTKKKENEKRLKTS